MVVDGWWQWSGGWPTTSGQPMRIKKIKSENKGGGFHHVFGSLAAFWQPKPYHGGVVGRSGIMPRGVVPRIGDASGRKRESKKKREVGEDLPQSISGKFDSQNGAWGQGKKGNRKRKEPVSNGHDEKDPTIFLRLALNGEVREDLFPLNRGRGEESNPSPALISFGKLWESSSSLLCFGRAMLYNLCKSSLPCFTICAKASLSLGFWAWLADGLVQWSKLSQRLS